jgi:hypothetical protein
MLNFVTDYPAECTNKEWQKKKSLKDKWQKSTKTGLGELLDNAQQKCGAINWIALDVRDAMKKVDASAKYRSIQEIQVAKAVGEAELKGPVQLARKALLAASKKATLLARDGKLSKDATAKATSMSKKLLEFEAYLRDITLDDFDDYVKKFQQLYDMEIKKLKASIQNLEAGLKAVAKDPTEKTWAKEVKQKCRSVGNTLGNFDEFREHWTVWKKFDGFQVETHPEIKQGAGPEREKQIVLECARAMLPHIDKLKKSLK